MPGYEMPVRARSGTAAKAVSAARCGADSSAGRGTGLPW
ncbi:Uncharacterised protein [Bordetella pertussis]|nr:Uncharacterised protein [Bordetella pertussis]